MKAQTRLLRKTESVCPVCLKRINAKVVEENSKVFLRKECAFHGSFSEIYWSDAELFKRFSRFQERGFTIENPAVKVSSGCPYDCGLCKVHESQTLLGVIDVTNRCNLKCGYCFANSAVAGYLYEPSFKEIEFMLDTLRKEKPLAAFAVLFSGGEPTIRKDMPDIVRAARNKGFTQILLATNGINIAGDLSLAKKLHEAGVSNLYLKCNGLTDKTNPENFFVLQKIIENCRKSGLQVTLVPTIINGFNDHEVFPLVKFALDNIDVVRAVNFQPVSFCGRMPAEKRKKQRFTIPDLIYALEKQSNGLIDRNAFFPIPSVVPLSVLAEKFLNEKQVLLSAHPLCGAASYLFKEKGKVVPINHFLNINNFLEELNELTKEKTKNGIIEKVLTLDKLRKILKNNVVDRKVPSCLNFNKLFIDLIKGDFSTLTEFHSKSLFIGIMHFQDPYNMDIARVKKCVIHYTTPDGRIIPFCAYNSMGYREKIEKANAKPLQ
jgi:hypothetical protein